MIEYGEPVPWGDDDGKTAVRRWISRGDAHPGDVMRVEIGVLRGWWYVERYSHADWTYHCRRYPAREHVDDVAPRVMAETGRRWEEVPVSMPGEVWVSRAGEETAPGAAGE